MAQKRIIFLEEDHKHARFRLQLRYDMIPQERFFKTLLELYLERDPLLLECLFNRVRNKIRNTRMITKDIQKKKETEELFALSDEEIENIFDVIAKEDEEL